MGVGSGGKGEEKHGLAEQEDYGLDVGSAFATSGKTCGGLSVTGRIGNLDVRDKERS